MVRVVIGKVVGDDGKSLDFLFDNPGYRFGVRKEGTNDDYIYSPSLKGDQGIQGEKGDKGDNVDAYIEGTTLYVAVGQDILDHNYTSVDLKGDQGIQGDKGDKGDNVDAYIEGTTLYVAVGQDILDHNYSSVDLKGDQGIQGLQGIQGIQGNPGMTGIFKGRVNTVSDLPTSPSEGDVYFLLNGDVYQYYNSAWSNVGNLKGDQGLQGIQGIQGNPGMTGIFKGRVNTVSDLPTSPSEGDVYFLLNGDVYQYYNSAWSNVGNLKGDKGDKGDTGETGSRSQIKGTVNDVASLPSTGNLEGDCYLIKDIGDLYSYLNSSWSNVGNLRGPTGTIIRNIVPYDALSDITDPEQGVIYIIPHAGGTNPNVYDEYFYIESLAQFEQIGQQSMDLSGYYLKTETYSKTEIDNLIGTANDIITG